MDFSVFDTSKIDEYARQAKEQWGKTPESDMVQMQVKKLQDYITEHFYKCSNEILCSLGQMYVGGGEFTANIDQMGGEGTAEFVSEAIRIYCVK